MPADSLTSLYSSPGSKAAADAASRTPHTRSDSTSTSAGQRTQDLSNRFLTLLVAQMKNQDPLNPTDNSKVTSQIAQINTVTGINDLNDTLNQINGQIDKSQQLQASALIGHQVLVPGQGVKVGDDGTATAFGVDLPKNAAEMSITITDDAGNVVHKSDYANQPAGVQSFSWDGKDPSDAKVDPGRYKVNITAIDSQGEAIKARPLETGYVNGVVAGQSGPQLDLGPSGLIALDDVYQIL
ncbi:flagellar hook assembly protein FlgD [Salinisphaera sp. Q1T1-3]|uniref:flagellar hook assembly protein FlgD n=1 Tax=Salinisphaera sp. Q1T1-3 TaxID=2321229 RepID=UPI000E747946|nr:flagellar hook assembly protein FlgD [Salinisphaera sp. Q1T1-3]RJS95172.1 flagellar hook assembly protein FlgD [Salinisphaera sp. Q1T1-3]